MPFECSLVPARSPIEEIGVDAQLRRAYLWTLAALLLSAPFGLVALVLSLIAWHRARTGDLEGAAGGRERADVHALHEGAGDRERDVVLGLAGRGAGMAADALGLVEHLEHAPRPA